MVEGVVEHEEMSGRASRAETGAERFSSLRFALLKLIFPLAQPSLANFPPEKIRNLVNIAHIDHGKS